MKLAIHATNGSLQAAGAVLLVFICSGRLVSSACAVVVRFAISAKAKPMKSGPFPWLVWVIILDVLSSGAAETNRPDCVGIRLGMSLAEARERLQRCEPKLEIQTAELQIPELGANPVPEILYGVRMPPSRTGALPAMDPIESLQAAITLPPNKPVVWKVVRSLRFEPGRKQSKSALLGTLHDKYGKESLTLDQATVTVFPAGSPSSLARPESMAELGSVIV